VAIVSGNSGSDFVQPITYVVSPYVCALTLELENVRLVVADVVEQLVPDWPFAIKPPAPQGFHLAAICLSVITG
jgi:hypothetical protein